MADRMAGYRAIRVEPLTGSLGAEISGVDLSRTQPDSTWAEIMRAFHENLVIFFRDQPLDAHRLAAVAERFGPLTRIPYAQPGREHPMVTELVREPDAPRGSPNIGDNWHCDQTPRERPSLAFALWCKECPPYGGDTLFANMYDAYDGLSDGMKEMCERLIVMHSASGKFGADGKGRQGGIKPLVLGTGQQAVTSQEVLDSFAKETEHPLVRVHAATGRKSLFLGGAYAIRFKGMTAAESKPLLDQLLQHAIRPDYTCRFRWRQGSLAIMDNRCTLHYAVNDYSGYRRHMLRTEMDGEVPFGPAKQAASEQRKVTVDA
jgi:taurine dioxygenase